MSSFKAGTMEEGRQQINYTALDPHIAERRMAIGSGVKYSMATSTALFPLGDHRALWKTL